MDVSIDFTDVTLVSEDIYGDNEVMRMMKMMVSSLLAPKELL